MYNTQLEWYDKVDVLSLFSITERTYFRKLKQISSIIRIKKIKNPKGRDSTLIYYKDLLNCFEHQRKPKGLSNPESLRKYVGASRWDYLGNVVPGKTTLIEIKAKMTFLFGHLKSLDKTSKLFYSIELNSKDEYFHSHFLIKSSLDKKTIYKLLKLICEDELPGENRIDIKKYDFDNYQFRGSFYSNKFGEFDVKHQSSFIHSQLL